MKIIKSAATKHTCTCTLSIVRSNIASDLWQITTATSGDAFATDTVKEVARA